MVSARGGRALRQCDVPSWRAHGASHRGLREGLECHLLPAAACRMARTGGGPATPAFGVCDDGSEGEGGVRCSTPDGPIVGSRQVIDLSRLSLSVAGGLPAARVLPGAYFAVGAHLPRRRQRAVREKRLPYHYHGTGYQARPYTYPGFNFELILSFLRECARIYKQ